MQTITKSSATTSVQTAKQFVAGVRERVAKIVVGLLCAAGRDGAPAQPATAARHDGGRRERVELPGGHKQPGRPA